jgi:hypothetical protein
MKNPKMSLKNPEFIKDSVKQIKKYDYRVKNRSYLRFCPAKSGFLDVNNEKCYFLSQEKTNFSAKINYTDVKRIRPMFPKLFETRHTKINVKISRHPYQRLFNFFPRKNGFYYQL